MMEYSEDHIALAGEYALGTLGAGERAQAEAMISADPAFARLVDAWVRQLGVLNQMVGSVEPPAEIWDRIKLAVRASQPSSSRHSSPQPGLVIADAPVVDSPAVDGVAPPEAASSVVDRPSADIVDLPRQLRRWRSIAAVSSAIAAALVALVGMQAYRPDLLPDVIRPKAPQPMQQTAQAPGAAQYVALLQKDGSSPAFILTVDAGAKNFTVRKVNAASEPGRSYELWLVSDKLQKPRSLGVIGGRDFTIRPEPTAYDADMVSKATYAVTVEREGGSPTGEATGPIVFSGKLIQTVPAPQQQR